MVAPSSGEGEQKMKLLLLRLWPPFGLYRLPYFMGREAFEGDANHDQHEHVEYHSNKTC
jgi:hypothetical protein